MALSVLIRIVGVLLLLGAVRLYIMFERQILPLNQRPMLYFVALATGLIGVSCSFAGDVLLLAAYMVLPAIPFVLIESLQLYFEEKKKLTKIQMYKTKFRQAQEEGDEDEMVRIHALAAACRWYLPRVKEAREENLEDWW